MKESIRHLPLEMQSALQRLTLIIRRMVHNTEMIIVLDKNDVEQQLRLRPRGIVATASGLDDLIVVIVSNANIGERRYDVYERIEKRLFQVLELPANTPSLLYFNISIPRLTLELAEGSLFCINLKKYGILLYNSGKFPMPEHHPVQYSRVAAKSQDYYEKFIPLADEFVWGAEQYSRHGNHVLATYLLYQAAEALMGIIQNIHLQYRMRHKQLMHWVYYCCREVPRIVDIFPCDNDEEMLLFQLLAEVNVNARFHPEFTVSPNDFDKLMSKIVALRGLTQQVCPERIAYYIRRSKD